MDLFFLFSKYFWLLCIGTTFINFLWADRRVDEADQGVDRALRRKYLAWMWGLQCLPWLVIGIGQLAGGVPSVWAVFRPQDGNPWIWAFYATGLLIALFMAWWVLFKDGARVVAELRLLRYHAPGRSGAMNAFWTKVFVVAGPLVFVAAIAVMFALDLPLPPMAR